MNEIDNDPIDDDFQDQKHLVFQLANEFYAAPLISIQEITKMQPIKPVPFMVPYFKGILNLRGAVVSVVDLRLKLELPCGDGAKGLLIVVHTPDGILAAIVDDVHSVHNFPAGDIETNLPLKTRFPVEFFKGVAHLGERLVNVIDLGQILAADNLAAVKRTS
jgi:purine-binding chemotaxis protein CheW